MKNGFIARGQVLQPDGAAPLAGAIVRLFDKDLREDEPLGRKREDQPLGRQVVTDARGRYEIAYSAEEFAANEEGGADLIARVYGLNDALLAESEAVFNAPRYAELPRIVVRADLLARSEYERLLNQIAPVRERVEPADFTDADLDFLTRETGAE